MQWRSCYIEMALESDLPYGRAELARDLDGLGWTLGLDDQVSLALQGVILYQATELREILGLGV